MRKPLVVLLAGASVAAVTSTTLLVSGAYAQTAPEGGKDGARVPITSAKDLRGDAYVPVGQRSARILGANRYETAVAISQERGWNAANTSVVFLATGDGFADALAIGPSSYETGPLLLTLRDALPDVVRAELDRLDPCAVIVLGGTAAVSDAVAQAADTYTEDCG